MLSKRNKIIILTVLIGLLNFSCDHSDDKELAKSKVLEFRQRSKQNEYDKIYEQACSKFKESVSKETFTEGLSNISSEVSDSENFVLENSKVNVDLISGTQFFLIYKPISEGRVVLEEYVFVKENGNLCLYNYRFDTKQ